jgi:hypothetical protein
MLTLRLLVAAAGADMDLKNQPITPAASGFMGDLLLVVGLGVVLAAALFLIVYLARKDKASRDSNGSRVIYRAERRQGELRPAEQGEHSGRRRRKKKEEFSQRNPTLGETGGLPPLRTEEEPAEPAS